MNQQERRGAGPKSQEIFSRPDSLRTKDSELTYRLTQFSGDFANAAIKGDLQSMVKFGGGREVIGSVPDRPDDNRIKLDDTSHSLFVQKALEHQLKLVLITEDGKFLVGVDREEDAEAIAAVDPIDNSGEHEAGLDTPPYIVFTFFDKNVGANGKYKPLVGGICDFLRERLLFYSEGKNRLFQYVDRKDDEERIIGWDIEEREIKQKAPKKITDPGFVSVTYMGSNLYSLPFIDNFRKLIEEMHPKGRFHGKGGSHAPLLLVTGADLYVMVDDIRTENSPGYVMAKAAGFGVWVYDLNGNVTDYEFDPKIEDSERRLHILIMARDEATRDGIIKYWDETQRENELQKSRKAFADSNPEAFELFRSSQAQPSTN